MLFDLKGNSTVTCADAVNYPSWYVYPPSYGTRSLTHVPAYEVGNSTFGTIDISDTISSDWKYAGGVLAPNGNIYLVPFNTDHIGELDPSTRTFGTINISDTISFEGKYAGGVLAPNGKIYLVPRNADHIGELDPSTRTFGTIDISDTISSYRGGVLAPNGKIYLVPYNADHIGELEVGNHQPSYEVAGGVPLAWAALLSPHFNKF